MATTESDPKVFKDPTIDTGADTVKSTTDPLHPDFVRVDAAPGQSIPGSNDPTPHSRVPDHRHDGNDGTSKIRIRDLEGRFDVVSVAPTNVPGNNIWEQIKIYENGGTIRLYFYDWKANVWRFK